MPRKGRGEAKGARGGRPEENVRSGDKSNRKPLSEAQSQLPYAPTKISALCSPGSASSLAPHPALVETHLAPCWTFIRPVSHQMLPCLGSRAAWPFAGEEARLCAQRGPGWELLDDRRQRGLMPSHPFCWHSVARNLQGKEEARILKASKAF